MTYYALVLVNTRKESVTPVLNKLLDELHLRGISYQILSGDDQNSAVHPQVNVIFAVGGDGTFLHATRRFAHLEVPFIGVDAGRVGFVMTTSVKDISDTIDKLVHQEIQWMERFMLEASVEGQFHTLGMNEIAVQRQVETTLPDFHVSVEGYAFPSSRSDGILVSSATGSTAYNFSAGGPVVYPGMDSLIITPLLPYLGRIHPLVLPGNVEITVEVHYSPAHVVTDGQNFFRLDTEVPILIRRSKQTVRCQAISPAEFLQLLHHKLR